MWRFHSIASPARRAVRGNNKVSPLWPTRLPAVDRVNQVWVSDMTHIPTLESWVYLVELMKASAHAIGGEAFIERVEKSLLESVRSPAARYPFLCFRALIAFH